MNSDNENLIIFMLMTIMQNTTSNGMLNDTLPCGVINYLLK